MAPEPADRTSGGSGGGMVPRGGMRRPTMLSLKNNGNFQHAWEMFTSRVTHSFQDQHATAMSGRCPYAATCLAMTPPRFRLDGSIA
jgi:hypothetical protein